MKLNRSITVGMLACALAMVGSPQRTQAQTIITNTYVFSFPTTGPAEAPFTDPTWIYWYNSPGGNTPITTDPTTWTNSPVPGGNTSANFGSLMVVSPLAGYTQNVFFGCFADNQSYTMATEANTLVFSSISFDILVDPAQPTNSSGNYGTIEVGVPNSGSGWSYTQLNNGSVTIPASASTAWYHVDVPIDQTQGLGDVAGVALDLNSYSGNYPLFTTTNWIANVSINGSTAPPPPPPTMLGPTKPVTGLNTFDTVPNSQYNRYQIINSNDINGSQLSFYGRPSVKYSWNIKQFPSQDTAYSYQAHFFIVSGSSANETDGIPNQYDQAADYNLANCLFLTVQSTGNGGGVLNFRYKTNEIGGNAMLFNTTSPTNSAGNPDGWPIMPVATCTSAAIVGTWSVTFADNTSVTIEGPDGTTTNFSLDAASSALFADPCSLILGSQPNSVFTDSLAQDVIYSSFSVSGTPSSDYTDNFTGDTGLNTNLWSTFGNDNTGIVLVPSTAAYWVGWTLPAPGFSLYQAAGIPVTNWVASSPAAQVKLGPQEEALINSSTLPAPNQGYFTLVSNTFSQLVVVLPGQTFTPGVSPGYSGTPTPVSSGNGGLEPLTVYAVDNHFNPVAGVSDTIQITDNSGNSADPNNAAMVNGVLSGEEVDFFGNNGDGPFIITASDVTNGGITAGMSAPVSIGP